MSTWTDERLATALAGLRDAIDLEPLDADEFAIRRARSTRRPRAGRRLLVAAAVLLVVVGAALLVPDSRRAIGDWFGLGTVSFERRTDADRVGTTALLDGAEMLDVDAALAEIDIPVTRFDATGLGRPTHAGRPAEGGVVLGWPDRSLTLWVVGLDLDVALSKQASADAVFVPVPELSRDAVLVDGPHDLFTPIRVVAAERVLWWLDDDAQYRLEGDLPADELVDLAISIRG